MIFFPNVSNDFATARVAERSPLAAAKPPVAPEVDGDQLSVTSQTAERVQAHARSESGAPGFSHFRRGSETQQYR